MTTTPEENGRLERAKNVVEIAGKIAVGLLACCYAFGLVTVNLYYSHYGVHSLSLFRVSYVTAGIWLLLPGVVSTLIALVAVGLFFSVKWVFKDSKTKPEKIKGGLVAIYWIYFAIISSFGVIVMLSLGIAFDRHWVFSSMTGFAVFFSIAMFVALYNRFESKLREEFLVTAAILVPMTFLFHTFYFAHNVYGLIPSHLGGGAARQVQLLVDAKDDEKKYFEICGLHFFEGTNQTRTAQLLFETENDLVLLVKAPESAFASTLSIKRELIKSIVFEGLRPVDSKER